MSLKKRFNSETGRFDWITDEPDLSGYFLLDGSNSDDATGSFDFFKNLTMGAAEDSKTISLYRNAQFLQFGIDQYLQGYIWFPHSEFGNVFFAAGDTLYSDIFLKYNVATGIDLNGKALTTTGTGTLASLNLTAQANDVNFGTYDLKSGTGHIGTNLGLAMTTYTGIANNGSPTAGQVCRGSTANKISVAYIDGDAVDHTILLSILRKGDTLYFAGTLGGAYAATFTISGTPTDSANYRTFPVTETVPTLTGGAFTITAYQNANNLSMYHPPYASANSNETFNIYLNSNLQGGMRVRGLDGTTYVYIDQAYFGFEYGMAAGGVVNGDMFGPLDFLNAFYGPGVWAKSYLAIGNVWGAGPLTTAENALMIARGATQTLDLISIQDENGGGPYAGMTKNFTWYAGDITSYPFNYPTGIYFSQIGLYLAASEIRTSTGFVVLDDMFGDGSILANVIQEFYGTIAIGDVNAGAIYLSVSDGAGGTETTSLTYLGFNFGRAAISKDLAFYDSGGLYAPPDVMYNTILINGNGVNAFQLGKVFQKQAATTVNGLDTYLFSGSPSINATDKSGGVIRFLGGDAEGNGGTHQEFWAVKQGQGTGSTLRTPNHIMSTYGDEVVIADSSQVGAEKITNGDFEAGSTGWTAGTGNTAGGYVFTTSAALTVNPAVGDTYTNNIITYTVKYIDITAGIRGQIIMTGSGDPTASGNLVRATGSGDNPIPYSSYSQGGNKDAGGTGTLSQTSAGMVSALVAGEWYNLTYTVMANTVGYVIPSIGGITLSVHERSGHPTSNGVTSKSYTEVFKAIDTTSLVFTPPVTGARYVIDNVSLKKITGGNATILGSINSFTNQTTINGLTGTVVWSMPFQGGSYKKTVMYLTNFTSAGTTITFPTSFSVQPTVYGDSTATAIAVVNTTTCVLTSVGAVSGFVMVEGY